MPKTNENTKSFAELERGEIPLSEIEIMFNFRNNFNEEKIKELADNIAKVGVLQPILLREENGQKILVAGERRYRAAQKAGLQTIPYRLLNLTAEEALEVTALENLHRVDLNPIEEAQAFKTLLDSGNYQVQDVADKVNKSQAYVYRAIRLLDLPESVKEALVSGKITTGHARHLLRLSAKEAEKVLEDIISQDMPVKQLANKIEWAYGKDLEEAVFPTNTTYADIGPCSICLHNTSSQQDLFDEEIEKGRCTNKECYQKKLKFFIDEKITQAKKEAKAKGFVFEKDTNKYPYSSRWQFNGHNVLDEDDKKALETEIAKNPACFGIGVDNVTGETRLFIVDETMKEKLLQIRREEDDTDETEEYDREREEFIREETNRLIMKSLSDNFQYTATPEEEENNLPFSDLKDKQKEWLLAKLQIKELSADSIKKLPGEKVFALFCLDRGLDSWDFEESICNILGIDYDELCQKYEKAAAKTWDKKQNK